jgi:hypothetical protein
VDYLKPISFSHSERNNFQIVQLVKELVKKIIFLEVLRDNMLEMFFSSTVHCMLQYYYAIFLFLFFLVKKRNEKDKAAPIALPALLNYYKSQECGRLKRHS